MNKQEIRNEFRSKVFERDKYTCVMCGYKADLPDLIDAHHINDRHYMPFGGYVAANGITLCTDRCTNAPWCFSKDIDCHQKAETIHATGQLVPGYTPTDLYARIKSNYKWAYTQSLSLSLPYAQVELMMQQINAISSEELEICLELTENISHATWELACDALNEDQPLIRAYGKGRYVSDF
jgi:hypothetical protein